MSGPGAKGTDGDTKFCSDCGATISRRAEICPKCGVRQIAAPKSSSSSRLVKGCLLILLLPVVVVVIGIIAAIAIPKFSNTKEKAYVAIMKSDLRNLATYEEQYAADNAGHYFSGDGANHGFTPSQNVSINATPTRNPDSWSATARHSQTSVTCAMTNFLITCTPAR